MSIDDLKALIPDHAKDLRLNIGGVLTSTALTKQQVWGTAAASAYACGEPRTVRAILAAAAENLSPEALSAAKSAAAIMGMNNVYYRYLHLSGTKDLKTMPARLRMQVIGNPGVDKLDFELWCLAVSAINGCGMCIESHEHEVFQKGASKEGVQDAVRIASVVAAVSAVLAAEAALA
jgi:alkyl hydroperoxide reductase subunit D